MKVIQQDFLALEKGILFHQVNCYGIMGGGIAAALAAKFPGLEIAYRKFCQDNYEGDLKNLLGKFFLWEIPQNTPPNTLYIANIFGQVDVSRHSRQTSYDAVCDAFDNIREECLNSYSIFNHLPLYFPYKMGCGLGGGDWKVYSAIIDRYFPNAIICQHNG